MFSFVHYPFLFLSFVHCCYEYGGGTSAFDTWISFESELRSDREGRGYERIVEEQAREVTGEMRGALFGAEIEHDC